jgi:hypothetical protein
MSTLADVEVLFARARRFQTRILAQRGDGATWTFTFPDGITERYTIRGMQPVEDLEADVASLFVWTWSLKDYLRVLAGERGVSPQRVEDLVNRTPALSLLGDVTNHLKHLKLRKKMIRSGAVPHLGRPGYKIEGVHNLKSLEFSAAGVVIEPARAEDVQIDFPVLDPANHVIADAIVLLGSCLTYWEQELAALR